MLTLNEHFSNQRGARRDSAATTPTVSCEAGSSAENPTDKLGLLETTPKLPIAVKRSNSRRRRSVPRKENAPFDVRDPLKRIVGTPEAATNFTFLGELQVKEEPSEMQEFEDPEQHTGSVLRKRCARITFAHFCCYPRRRLDTHEATTSANGGLESSFDASTSSVARDFFARAPSLHAEVAQGPPPKLSPQDLPPLSPQRQLASTGPDVGV